MPPHEALYDPRGMNSVDFRMHIEVYDTGERPVEHAMLHALEDSAPHFLTFPCTSGKINAARVPSSGEPHLKA